MEVTVEMSEIKQTSTTTEPNKYKIELVAIGERKEIEIYFDWLRDQPDNNDLKEIKYDNHQH